ISRYILRASTMANKSFLPILLGLAGGALLFMGKSKKKSGAPILPSPKAVTFTSDLSKFNIGKDWFQYEVVPFVKLANDEGKLDTAFEDFVSQRSVIVGVKEIPIKDLPGNQESVIRFFDKLE